LDLREEDLRDNDLREEGNERDEETDFLELLLFLEELFFFDCMNQGRIRALVGFWRSPDLDLMTRAMRGAFFDKSMAAIGFGASINVGTMFFFLRVTINTLTGGDPFFDAERFLDGDFFAERFLDGDFFAERFLDGDFFFDADFFFFRFAKISFSFRSISAHFFSKSLNQS
jgi:hypothetical protein